jgi:tRNA-specific 2-thiouridylase
MRVMAAMSGGVDSSVAAALLVEAGHEVVGVTMKLWGGPSDSGCCSVSEVDDARRVAAQIGIDHHVFNFTDDFDTHVVEPYVDAHREGMTPNPCVECNRHLKFDRLLDRAVRLGFDSVATGHHARVVEDGGRWRLRRGVDAGKDQSYVLSVLDQSQLRRTLMPIGPLTKAEVRDRARRLGLRSATKPDSQDTCFIVSADGPRAGRSGFLGERMELHPGRLVDAVSGAVIGEVAAVELVTVGQRRGLGTRGGGSRRYALDVDPGTATVVVGDSASLLSPSVPLSDLTWVDGPLGVGEEVLAQSSAHGPAVPAVFDGEAVVWREARKRVAPGQTVALYRGDDVLGSGRARRG